MASLFFAFFLAFGLLFIVFMAREIAAELETWRWNETPCTILSSGVTIDDDADDPYRLTVTYRYAVRGIDHFADRVARTPVADDDYRTVARRASRWAPGVAATCFVDPDDPGTAVLVRRLPWWALFILVPLVFVAIGGGGLAAVWRRSRDADATADAPISARPSSRRGAIFMVVFGAIFAIVGAGALVPLLVVPAARLVQASGWLEVPCEVVSSTVRASESDDGTTYRVDILYEYDVGGRTWRSNRFGFADWGSSGYRSKRELADRYPAGHHTVCFVDPGDPTLAVLDRSFRPVYLVGLAPLLFLGAGLAVAAHGLRVRRRHGLSTAAGIGPGLPTPGAEAAVGPVELRPRAGPMAKLFGAIVFCLIWNGIVSVFLVQVVQGWQAGERPWGMTLFLTPFVLVGAATIVFVGHFLLAAFNPRPRVTVGRSLVRLGDRVQLEWRFAGRAGRIERLRISLEGREEATYRRGTDTRTDREVFARIPVVDTELGPEIARGVRTVEVPRETMHTFAAVSNKVAWSLKVSGEIARWPDVDEELEVVLHPIDSRELR